MQIIDLFSGIGGFSLAGHWVGWKTVQFCEIDAFCGKVLSKNFPGVPIHQDIKTLTRDSILENGIWKPNEPTIVVGGFPCQPYSHAGQRKGNDDDRALWPEMLRVIREVAPTWVIGENVAGLITMDGGRVFDGIVSDLENAGYSVEAFVIPACAVGAPHRRDRLWIVARRDSEREQQPERLVGNERGRVADGDKERVTADANIFGRQRRQDDKRQESAGRSGACNSDCATANANGTGLQKQHLAAVASGSGFSAGRVNSQWHEHWLPVATRLCRVDDGISRRMDRGKRLKALGNAIVPQVAYQIFKAIMQNDHRPRPHQH